MSGARLTVSDIDEILLVGGATRTPLVARRLEEDLKLQPRGEVDPDLCVAMGAAIQAALIAGAQTQTVLVDVTPYTFGTGAVGELDGEPYPYCFVPLIRKNTPIPVSKSEVFYTMFDGQDKVDVTVYQGEDPDALNNIEIGRFMVEGLRNAPAGNPVVLSFALDLNGILQVTAREKQTGLEYSITIDNAIARFEQDKLDEARSRVQALFGEEEQARRCAGGRERPGQPPPARGGARPGGKGGTPAGKGPRGGCRRPGGCDRVGQGRLGRRGCAAAGGDEQSWPTCSTTWNREHGALPRLPCPPHRRPGVPALRLRSHARASRRSASATASSAAPCARGRRGIIHRQEPAQPHRWRSSGANWGKRCCTAYRRRLPQRWRLIKATGVPDDDIEEAKPRVIAAGPQRANSGDVQSQRYAAMLHSCLMLSPYSHERSEPLFA
ncbi:MAG: Hsp70 family protein [Candidatus Moduliflexus flocculans]|nr:Hsp70 family protein [Candidatus Moduliflexus flocculans]